MHLDNIKEIVPYAFKDFLPKVDDDRDIGVHDHNVIWASDLDSNPDSDGSSN